MNRFSTIFYTFVSAMGLAASLCHVTSYFFYPNINANIEFLKIHDFTLNNYLQMDQANLSFKLDLDLSEEFHWNQNQLFVYALVQYESDSNKLNEVVIWDEIVRSKEEAVGHFFQWSFGTKSCGRRKRQYRRYFWEWS